MGPIFSPPWLSPGAIMSYHNLKAKGSRECAWDRSRPKRAVRKLLFSALA